MAAGTATAVAEHGGSSDDQGERWWTPPGATLIEPVDPVRPNLSTEARALENLLFTYMDGHDLSLPPLPRVPERVLKRLRSAKSSLSEVANDISEDQVIAAAVLRMANSPLYRGLDRINGLSQAVVRLGGNAIRTLMLQQSLRAVAFQSHGGYEYAEMLWTRAMAAGCIARGLGPFAGIDEETAFLMGLLHDIGGVIVVRAAHSQRQIAGYDVPEADFEFLCYQSHQEFGELIAESWQLPDELKSIISDHHCYPEADDPHRIARLVVILTDMITSMLGYAPQPANGVFDLINCRPVKDLGLQANARFHRFLDELPDRLEESVHSF